MAQIFPKWTNHLGHSSAITVLLLLAGVTGFFWFYGSPKYLEVGYRPAQPVDYSHKLHAGDLGIDCRYCHSSVEYSANANVPPTATCMNCHTLVQMESEKLQLVRDSWNNKESLEWVRVHDLPDFAYFNHSIHINAGVGCIECHGNVAQMEKVTQEEPLSMSWCLDCHRNPEPNLRPVGEVTNMKWERPPNQEEMGRLLRAEKDINPPQDCSGCHR